MTVLQKLLVPRWSDAISSDGLDEVGGPVVRAGDVVELSPAELVAAHGWSGRPFDPDPAHVDVLRFESSPLMRLDVPREAPRSWPTYPHGFLLEGAVPVWRLALTRVPTGTEFWRIRRDGSQQHFSTYGGPALGWEGARGYQPPLALVGVRARWQGIEIPAALSLDRTKVELVHVGPEGAPAGFEEVRPMVQRRIVPLQECEVVFELEVTARFRERPVRVIRSDGARARVHLLDPDDTAPETGAVELEPGLWELVVPVSDLTDRSGVQRDLDVSDPVG